jgi:hypothetical protein
MWYDVVVQFHSFACGYPVVPAGFVVERAIVLASLLKIRRS